MNAAAEFLKARDFLLAHRTDQDLACRDFRWPRMEEFNWALDYFDQRAAGTGRPALHVVHKTGGETILTFAEIARRSNRVARYLRRLGVRRGDRMLLMLGNEVPLWETVLA